MEFGLKEISIIVGWCASCFFIFFTTKYGLKEKLRNQKENFDKEITSLKLHLNNVESDFKVKLNDLESKYKIQEYVVKSIDKSMNDLIPKLIQAVNHKEKVDG